MMKKIVGIIVMTLLIATALPAVGIMNEFKPMKDQQYMAPIETKDEKIIIFNPIDDATVSEGYPDVNYGTETYLSIQSLTEEWKNMRSYLKFDLSIIPDDATITSVSLKLYCFYFWFGNTIGELYSFNGTWEETTITWNNQLWKPESDPLLVRRNMSSNDVGSWCEWSDSSKLIGYIQDCLENDTVNLMLKSYPESASALFSFWSKELGDYIPELVINFEYTQNYELLIIANDSFIDELVPLKQFKDLSGRPTILIDLNYAYENFKGVDTPEQIKRCIAYHEMVYNIDFVMIVGDCDKFPVRYISKDMIEPRTYKSCDLYYADLYKSNGIDFDNWDGDGDDLYAELDSESANNNVDNVNWHPDIFIGRVPASDENDVSTYVDKIINYEMSDNSPWFENALFIGGDWNPGISTKEKISNNYLSGFIIHKLYHNGAHGQQHPTPALIKSHVDNGVGFLNYYGHGNDQGWAEEVAPPYYYQASDVQNLNNPSKLPIVFSAGCDTGGYSPCPPWQDYTDKKGVFHPGQSPSGTTETPNPIQPSNCDREAMPEYFLVYYDVGAITYLGSVGGTNYGYPAILDEYFFEAYDQGFETYGEMWWYMIEEYLDELFDSQGNAIGNDSFNRQCAWNQLIMFHPFGDPSLKVGGFDVIQINLDGGDGCVDTVIFDDIEYSLEEKIETNIGNHTLRIGAIPKSCNFESWESSDNISIENPESNNTTIYVDGDGTITINSHIRGRNKEINNPFLHFLQKYQNLFPILRYLLRFQ
jgi:hypothetical protein